MYAAGNPIRVKRLRRAVLTRGVFPGANAQSGCGEQADVPRFDEFVVLYSALFHQETMCFSKA